MKTDEFVGKKIYRLTIMENLGKGKVRVLCECGTEKSVSLWCILRKISPTKSCGCLNLELIAERGRKTNLKHGKAKTPEYKTWTHMIGRCYCKSDKKYPRYGGRGIVVCDKWRYSFETFLKDVGPRPGPGYSIDRINNDGNYEPSNCKWSNNKEQANNRSLCKQITINGITLNRTQWIERLGLNYNSVMSRLNQGWDEVSALTTPFKKHKKHQFLNQQTGLTC